jgi:hypothetical protein
MLRPLLIVLSGVALAAGDSYSTDYGRDRALRVEVESSATSETTDMSIEVDGEPMEGREFGGSGSSAEKRVVYVDRVLERDGSAPSKVHRSFEEIEGTSVMSLGENDMESSNSTPLAGVTLEITEEDGEVTVEVIEGDAPDDDTLLEGHLPGLALDALLPDEEVDVDDAWDLDSDAVLRALGLDVERALFAPPARDDEEGGGGGRGGGRRWGGRRGGGGFPMSRVEWEGSATLAAVDEELDGVACVRIHVEIESSGELEEPERGGGGGGRGRAFDPTAASATALETTYNVTLKGDLWFSAELGMPLRLEIEGENSVESVTERERNESVLRISRTQEGTFRHVATVSVVADDE